ncbi:MAG: hypothetical protein AABX94_01405, partial [Nanoarchaeota archaeon]
LGDRHQVDDALDVGRVDGVGVAGKTGTSQKLPVLPPVKPLFAKTQPLSVEPEKKVDVEISKILDLRKPIETLPPETLETETFEKTEEDSEEE